MLVGCALPVLVLPDPEPLDQVFGALEPGVQAVFLAFEAGHILHGHTGEQTEAESIRGNYITMFAMRENTFPTTEILFL